ncbi:unnamed protein product [Cylicostephanus goldi]|uniref:Methyltransferase domain-containing protein n=1 Tax=Cylicostephanus goldi TaxID=71465 RepID=A0A3P6SKM6_CYLGO|nr:unnamed protein product [Cylicostephanus goldi]
MAIISHFVCAKNERIENEGFYSDDNILELGYGRGNALQYCFDRISEGEGVVFGIDRSPYMYDCALHRFALEIAETGKIRLDHAPDLRNLPYPSGIFDHIFHVDLFYFIHQNVMNEVCRELWRVLRPGGTMVCGMQFERLKKLSHWGLLEESQWDPLRYMTCLEPAGFVDVKKIHFSASIKPYQAVEKVSEQILEIHMS